MIKWEHSIFVLPFALCGAMLAANGLPSGQTLAWIIVAMVAARSAAMAFNRLADASIDAANPRTQTRALPAGTLTPGFVITFVLVSCAIFVFAASQLNRLSFILSPVALAIVLLYSYTKRFTRWSHLVLGFAMGIAPSAAWIAVRGSLDPRILLLTAAVTFWGAGFDVLYACQDYEFDQQTGLHSIPRYFGIGKSLWIARGFHLMMILLLVSLVVVFGLGKLAVVGVLVVALLLVYEHSLVSPHDLSKLNAAFFTMNGVISVVFFFFLAGDLLLRG
jgi:4-hydroxybenzoate polyprenyltransferase